MFRYAQLNNEDIVVCISELTGEHDKENMILINDLDVKLGSFYNRKTEDFIPPETTQPTETIEQKITRLEQTIEQNNLMSLDIQLGLYEQLMTLQNQLNGGN